MNIPRIEKWLITYLGVEDTDYAKTVGPLWLIQAVARIYQPGCKADAVLTLEGDQDLGKSTVGQILFGPWFCDRLPDLGSKDSFLQLLGMWCIELAELDVLGRADSARIKGFVSSSVDRLRLPYGHQAINLPRSTVFLGTGNHDTYLKDETGNRRFWPVLCGKIDLKELKKDRDQLLAEAVYLYLQGKIWWIIAEETKEITQQAQADRYEADPWEEKIEKWVDMPFARTDESGFPVEEFSSTIRAVSVADILAHCIGKKKENWVPTDQNRVVRALRSLGFRKFRDREGELRPWRYRRDKIMRVDQK